MTVPASDADLGALQPLARVRRVRRMLLPKAVYLAVITLDREEGHLPKWEARLRSVDRLYEWAQAGRGMQELQHQLLDGDQMGNLMELERAFRWMIQHIEGGDMDTLNLATQPQAVALQVIAWWRASMYSKPGSPPVMTLPDVAVATDAPSEGPRDAQERRGSRCDDR
jgi:hypothetical protein